MLDIYHIFIHSSINGQLGCFHIFLYSLGKYPAVQLLDCKIVLFLTFWGTSILFSTVVTQFAFPPMMHMVPFSPHSCQHLLFPVLLILAILTGKHQFLDSTSRVFWFGISGVGPRICISNKFPSDTKVLVQSNTWRTTDLEQWFLNLAIHQNH